MAIGGGVEGRNGGNVAGEAAEPNGLLILRGVEVRVAPGAGVCDSRVRRGCGEERKAAQILA